MIFFSHSGKLFSKFLQKIVIILRYNLSLVNSYCLSANHNPELRCVICTGVTHFALVLHLNCTALSQSESSSFFMYIISNKTHLEGITHHQTIICRQLFKGHVVGSWPMKRKKNTSNVNDRYTVYLLCQDVSVYPPNMYWPTLMIVTVGPFSSQLLWNIDAFQPSVLACQHRSK